MNQEEKPSKETLKAWSNDPGNWKWGIFYYNKLDKRLIPPKRNPAMGYTINFANRKSILFFVFLIFIPLIILIAILKFAGA
jgi:uncharacterized membrane protein